MKSQPWQQRPVERVRREVGNKEWNSTRTRSGILVTGRRERGIMAWNDDLEWITIKGKALQIGTTG